MVNLKSLTYKQLEEYVEQKGEKKFRAQQIFSWLHKGAESFEDMTNISAALAEKLIEDTYISVPEISAKQCSKDGTVKYAWRLADGECVESVVMEYKHGISICVSTQAGCAMGCRFCASTLGGKVRDLSAGEILDQIIFAQKDMGVRISNIVLMGIGEPLDNYENVITFLKNVSHEKGLNIGLRHISLSTCGLADKIYTLADEGLPVTLSVSLHAPFDDMRSRIMPINKKYNISELMKACRYYIQKTGRRISFEYTMIHNVNDSEACAAKLASLVRGMQSHVNLIPVNKAREDMNASTRENIMKFKNALEKRNVNVTLRRTLGGDIDASCGQLRAKTKNEGCE